MGCCCCVSREDIVLPVEPAEGGLDFEYSEFERLVGEDIAPKNPHGWVVKKDWPAQYKHGFKMRVSLRPHDTGNPNNLLRGDGKYQGVTPQDFLDFLLNPELPGLQELKEVETTQDGCIKYCRVKAPCMKPRDHVWRYCIDKREDGSIFVCIRTTTHPKHPPIDGVIRAYYYNATILRPSTAEQGVMEMTEFIFQDLKGGISPSLMNSALPAGTISANKKEMEYLRKKKN
eukprot:TRINITY_DN14336_c0_g1_i1.p1 TRINITY_DN14336_c0_g1~~TRINITY_DN14336_c0_g1_i1.p1  ORF type:complete len:230 (+),score=40.08 TRINITY_DN14336_c0_g1_i1:60-749(+)